MFIECQFCPSSLLKNGITWTKKMMFLSTKTLPSKGQIDLIAKVFQWDNYYNKSVYQLQKKNT